MDERDAKLIVETVRLAHFCQKPLAEYVSSEIERARTSIERALAREAEYRSKGKPQFAAACGREAARLHHYLCRMLILREQYMSWQSNNK